MDQLTKAYEDLLYGSYDCPDRIVLRAYHKDGIIAGAFRLWWRRLHGSDETLDNTHLLRMAGRFSRRLRGYCKKHDIPVVDCGKGERKHEVAAKYLPKEPEFVGLFAVLVASASAPAWHVHKRKDGTIRALVRKYPYVKHYHFHIIDPEWGHITIRMSGHPPFGAQIIVNGHEYVARRAAQAGIELVKDGNCFTGIMNDTSTAQQTVTGRDNAVVGSLESVDVLSGLTQIADTLSSEEAIGQLRQLCDRWLYSTCLHFGLPINEQIRSDFRYKYTVFQVEVSRNLLFKRGSQLEQCFQALIDRTRSRLGLKRLRTIFGRFRRPCWSSKQSPLPREEIVISQPNYDLTIFKINFGKLTVKLYSKSSRILRCEAIVHNTKALRGRRSLPALPNILAQLQSLLLRFLDQLHILDSAFITDDTLDSLGARGQVGKSVTAGIDLNQARIRAVLAAVVQLAATPADFSASDLACKVQQHLGNSQPPYLPRHAAYDLKKLRGKQWVTKVGNSRRYAVSKFGLKTISALIIVRDKLIKPLLASTDSTFRCRSENDTKLDNLYWDAQSSIHALLLELGLAL